MNESSTSIIKGKYNIQSPIIYSAILYIGFFILMLFFCFAFNEHKFELPYIPYLPFTALYYIGIIIIFLAQIYWCVLFYQLWRYIINKSNEAKIKPSIASPGAAVGYLFIPLFNLYWMFKAIIGLNLSINKYLRHMGKNIKHSLTVSILIPTLVLAIIPASYILSSDAKQALIFLFILIAVINVLVLYPVYTTSAISICRGLEVVHIEHTVKRINGINDLFSYKNFGFNSFLFFFLLILTLLDSFTSFNISPLINGYLDEIFWTHPTHSLLYSFLSLVWILYLLFVISFVKNDFLIIIIYTLGRTLLSVLYRYTLTTVSIAGLTFGDPFGIRAIIYSISYNFLFIFALFIAIKYVGPKVWSFVFIFPAAYLLQEILIQIYNVLINNSSFQIIDFSIPIVNGIADGLLIWAGIIFYLRYRGYKIAGNEVVDI